MRRGWIRAKRWRSKRATSSTCCAKMPRPSATEKQGAASSRSSKPQATRSGWAGSPSSWRAWSAWQRANGFASECGLRTIVRLRRTVQDAVSIRHCFKNRRESPRHIARGKQIVCCGMTHRFRAARHVDGVRIAHRQPCLDDVGREPADPVTLDERRHDAAWRPYSDDWPASADAFEDLTAELRCGVRVHIQKNEQRSRAAQRFHHTRPFDKTMASHAIRKPVVVGEAAHKRDVWAVIVDVRLH